MKYSREDDHVTLEMSLKDYERLLMIFGMTLGYLKVYDEPAFWHCLQFVNEMNTGNPQFTQYEIPEDKVQVRPQDKKESVQ
jgi:hypothetical protein